jgi:hypothetical protein
MNGSRHIDTRVDFEAAVCALYGSERAGKPVEVGMKQKKEPEERNCALPASVKQIILENVLTPATAGLSHSSGTAEPDAHLVALHQYRDPAVAAQADHLFHILRIFEDILIDDR